MEITVEHDRIEAMRAAIDALLDEIVCDQQCGYGYLPDGSWGWVCGCGNGDVIAKIRAELPVDTGHRRQIGTIHGTPIIVDDRLPPDITIVP